MELSRSEVQMMIDASNSKAYKNLGDVFGALGNRALVDGNPAVHQAGQATITPFAGMLLTAKTSGVFMVSFNVEYQAAAADAVTYTVTTYAQAAAGVPITLPANAAQSELNGYVDNSGAGIAPTAGATAAHVVAAPAKTIGTAAVNDVYSFNGLCTATGAAKGLQFYVTLSVTNSIAARVVSALAMSAFELAP